MIEVVAQYDPSRLDVRIWVFDRYNKVYLVNGEWKSNPIPDSIMEPTWIMPMEVAQQVWLQLGSELKLTTERKEEVTWLRDDLNHERTRVDKFIDYMIGDE